jgi:hypothetical protein
MWRDQMCHADRWTPASRELYRLQLIAGEG